MAVKTLVLFFSLYVILPLALLWPEALSKEAVFEKRTIVLVVLEPDEEEKKEKRSAWAQGINKIEKRFGGRIKMISDIHEYDARKIVAVIAVESAGNPRAVSLKGARGLMQLMEGTARDMGISDPFHPYDNIWAGTKYLKRLEEKFGSFEYALAAYNLGPKRLERKLKQGFDPHKFSYVKKVKEIMAVQA